MLIELDVGSLIGDRAMVATPSKTDGTATLKRLGAPAPKNEASKSGRRSQNAACAPLGR
jgi:hypothetical protein